MRPTIDKIALLIVFLFFIALTFFFADIPFFWDEVYYIESAHTIFNSSFHSIIPSLEFDKGNFPFYGFYMALWWKIFGKTLLVSHIAMLPFLLGIAWEYYQTAKKYLTEKWVAVALLLLLLEPTFITQNILMGHDLMLVYFFFLSVNALLEGKRWKYAVALCLLALHNLKGIPATFSVILLYFLHVWFVKGKKMFLHDWIINFLPVLLWACWILYHHQATDLYFFTPVNENDFGKGITSGSFLLKKFILEFWQIIDFGRIFIWIFILYGLIALRNKMLFLKNKFLLAIVFVPLFIALIVFDFIDINFCHRYYMNIFLLANILLCFLIEKILQKNLYAYILISIISAGLLTGNFWIYSGGFSNGWDSSLKVLPYFHLKNEMDDFVKKEGITPGDIGTRFPLYQDSKYAYLSGESFHFYDIGNDTLEKYHYVLLSNVSNLFSVNEKKELNLNWVCIKEFSSGLVYLRLFKNPKTK